jgi:hypothetical protein
MRVTNGGAGGTSGGRDFGPWLLIALVGGVVLFVNATSELLEIARAGAPYVWWEPVLWEASSAAIIVAMAPLVGRAMRRWPPSRDSLLRFGAIHLALTVPFALAHVAAIFAIRNAVYWLAGRAYHYFDDGIGIVLIYEWRKDVLVYAVLASVYWAHDRFRQQRPSALSTAADEPRIEVRDGGAAIFLAPADIFFVEAAGNYVEFHTRARTHLVRGTLAHWERQLAARGFTRVHRSRLVNRAHVAALKPTASGDLQILLDDGRALAGSRRYREAFAALSKP